MTTTTQGKLDERVMVGKYWRWNWQIRLSNLNDMLQRPDSRGYVLQKLWFNDYGEVLFDEDFAHLLGVARWYDEWASTRFARPFTRPDGRQERPYVWRVYRQPDGVTLATSVACGFDRKGFVVTEADVLRDPKDVACRLE